MKRVFDWVKTVKGKNWRGRLFGLGFAVRCSESDELIRVECVFWNRKLECDGRQKEEEWHHGERAIGKEVGKEGRKEEKRMALVNRYDSNNELIGRRTNATGESDPCRKGWQRNDERWRPAEKHDDCDDRWERVMKDDLVKR